MGVKRIWCRLVGHDWLPVRKVGVVARPGGMLPSLDGLVAYEPHSEGEHRACRRCRQVRQPEKRCPESGWE